MTRFFRDTDVVPVKKETFISEKSVNTSILDTYQLSVIYAEADNTNLTKTHEMVYLYPGFKGNLAFVSNSCFFR